MLRLSDIPHMAALVSNMDEGLIVYSAEGEVVFKNPVGAHILSGQAEMSDVTKRITEWKTEAGKQYRAVLYVFPE